MLGFGWLKRGCEFLHLKEAYIIFLLPVKQNVLTESLVLVMVKKKKKTTFPTPKKQKKKKKKKKKQKQKKNQTNKTNKQKNSGPKHDADSATSQQSS